jgi:plastocyanin
MRRPSVITVALLTFLGTLAIATPQAGAKTGNCGTAASAKKLTDSHGDMHHGTDSTDQKCPVVASARKITVTGNDFTFAPAQITVAAGETITIKLTAADIAHDLFVQGIGHVVHAKADKSASGSIRIKKAGTYKYWCTILGHKKQGMTGTITVT